LELGLCEKYKIPHSVFMGWEPEDRAKAMAYRIEEASRCQMCGTAEWEWAENRFAYEPSSHFCQGCYLKDTHQKDGQTLDGTTTVLIPTDQISYGMRERQARAERSALAEALQK
jgi:hypothetical protein